MRNTSTLTEDDGEATATSRRERKGNPGESSLLTEGNKVCACRLSIDLGVRPAAAITFRTAYCACNWRAPPVPWSNTTAVSASDIPCRWPPPAPTGGCSSSGILTLPKPSRANGEQHSVSSMTLRRWWEGWGGRRLETFANLHNHAWVL